MPLLLLPVLALGVAAQGGGERFAHRFAEASAAITATPASMLYLNLSLASLTLIAMAVLRVVHRLSPRWLFSIQPGMRWRYFALCTGAAVLAIVAATAISQVLPNSHGASGVVSTPRGQMLATAAVILLTTPLQALGEECLFRGYLLQVFGSWSRSRAVAVLATATLFALAHGIQNAPLFFDRLTFGLMAGTLVILTGGLEAAIALHVLNNLVAFGMAVATNQLDAALTVTATSWWQVPITVTEYGLFAVFALLIARRVRLGRTVERVKTQRATASNHDNASSAQRSRP